MRDSHGRAAGSVLRSNVVAALLAAASAGGCAPIGPYQGANPAPGAITNFSAGTRPPETSSGHRWAIQGTRPEAHHLGLLAAPADADSFVVIVYGDNRPGYRTRAQSLGFAQVQAFDPSRPATWLPAAVGVPLALVQLVVPTLDGAQDLVTAVGTHRPNGGREAQVIDAIQAQYPVDLVVNSGDLVYDGRRGRLWQDFTRKHEALRRKAVFIAAPGNHERIHEAGARAAWDATVGPPPQPGRYWYTLDFPNESARFVILDSNVLTDAKDVYPDDLEDAISEEQLQWLDAALDTPARHRFVVLHHPLFTSGSHAHDWGSGPDDPAWRRRARIEEIFARRGVTAVFAGHEHLYHRVFVRTAGGGGFWHVTTGGAGSPLYPPREATRRASLARPMAADLTADPVTSRVEVVYHFCRLALPGADGAPIMDVLRVHAGGGTSHLERVVLSAQGS